MKKIYLILLTICFAIIITGSYATNWHATKHMFRANVTWQGFPNIPTTVNDMNFASVYYKDNIYNFANKQDYWGVFPGGLQLVKTKYQDGWKTDDGSLLVNNLYRSDWQPAPVVFHDSLFVFVIDSSGNTAYTWYNPAHNKCSRSKQIGNFRAHGMSAVVLDNKLCLVYHGADQYIKIYWTSDLVNWHSFNTGLINIATGSGNIDYISAITASYADTDKQRKSKLVFAYLDGGHLPQYAECKFSDSITLAMTKSGSIGNSTCKYLAVALAEGTISCPIGCPDGCESDNTSTGDCIQAFLKKEVVDNGGAGRRIKRLQLKNGVWTEIESNLTAMNPYWAHGNSALSACIYYQQDAAHPDTIRRYICLQYWNTFNGVFPDFIEGPGLCIAWAPTNKLVYLKSKNISNTPNDSSFFQYLGYIEGPPPYHINGSLADTATWYGAAGFPISKVTFTDEVTQSTSATFSHTWTTTCKYLGGGKILPGLSGDISQVLNHLHKSDNSTSLTTTITKVANGNRLGTYIISRPTIIRGFYHLVDVKKNVLDTIYYFFADAPFLDTKNYALMNSLDPGNPMTYLGRDSLVGYTDTSGIVHNVYDGEGGNNISQTLRKSRVNSSSNSIRYDVSVGLLGKLFSLGMNYSVSYTCTTTTSTSTTLQATCALKAPKQNKPDDITHMNYETYWINPSPSTSNWWLYPTARDQKTWCITYNVTDITYVNGDHFYSPPNNHITHIDPGQTGAGTSSSGGTNNLPGSSGREQPSNPVFSLDQNYPNPFKETTKIKYQIGSDDSQNGTGGLGIPTKLFVTSMTGSVVETLVDDLKTPGSYTVNWNTSKLQPGIYFYTLQAGTYRNVKKLILLK